MNKKTLAGAVLLVLGVTMLFYDGDSFSPGSLIGMYWPSMFILPLGLFFHWLYFTMTAPKAPGILVPGGVLMTAGIVCQISMLFDSWGYMWPGFILAPAVGLLELYWFGGRNKYLLIPISILTVLACVFFFVFTLGTLLGKLMLGGPAIAAALILIGAVLLFMPAKRI